MLKIKYVLIAVGVGVGLFIAAMLVVSAMADEAGADVPCEPLEKALKAGDFRPLNHDQWIAARALYAAAPPASPLPPGDSALMRDNGDETSSVVFVDGDEACAPLRIGKGARDLLRDIGAGVVNHAPGRM